MKNMFSLAGGVGLNGIATYMAAGQETLRWTHDQSDSLMRDYRLWAGIGGVVLNYATGGGLAKTGEIIAVGALNSLVATEAMRKRAIQRTEAMQLPPAPLPQQLPAGQQQFGPNLASFVNPFLNMVPRA